MLNKLLTRFSSKQKQLARWAAWFFLANALLWMLIATNYLSLLPNFNTIVALTWQARVVSYVFIMSSYLGYFSLVAYAAWLLVGCLSIYAHQRWVSLLSISLAVMSNLILVVDSLVYHLFHFHLWGVVWSVVSAGVAADVLVLSVYEWLLIVALVFLFSLLELVIARIIWRLVGRYTSFKQAKPIAYLIALSFFLSYALLIKSYAAVQTKAEVVVSTQLINLEAQLIPYYNNLMGLLLPERDGWLKLQLRGGGAFLQLDKKIKQLNYPLHPMQCQTPAVKPNILIIVVDALRYEALNARVMPKLTQFAQQSWQFTNHFSAGNATGPGIFTLLYGLPYNYWSAMLQERRAPILLDELQKQHYQMAIYRSASMEYPAFNKTVFATIKNLQLNTPGKRAYLRDQKITQQFARFLKQRNSHQAFFGFLFYDALHNYCQRPTPYAPIFKPAVAVCNRAYLNEDSDPLPYLNRYYNAAHFVDELIGEVLTDLKQQQLLNDTLVIITADHGEEFNDSHKNYWGHVSAYTQWQLQVPFILHVPGEAADKIAAMSTHYDLVPYLMQSVLGCTNPASDYSVGSSLLNPQKPDFFVVNSYVDYAILNDQCITHIYPQGNYLITDRQAEPILDAQLDQDELAKVFKQLNRYFAS